MTDRDTDPNESMLAMAAGRGIWDATGQQLSQLIQPLTNDRVAHRSQGGSRLSYVEAWDIKRMLIRIFGFANFSADVLEAKVLKIKEFQEQVMIWKDKKPVGPKLDANGHPEMKDQFIVLAQCTVRLTIHGSGATYTESAAASQKGADIGEVTDFAIKTAESDALKRAAIYLGTQFGLSLYNDGSLADIVGNILEPFQQDLLREWVAKRAQEQQRQRTQIAAGAPVQQEDQPAQPPQQQQRPPQQQRQAPPQQDDRPMALQDPNAGDGMAPPPTTARSAVAGAFNHGAR